MVKTRITDIYPRTITKQEQKEADIFKRRHIVYTIIIMCLLLAQYQSFIFGISPLLSILFIDDAAIHTHLHRYKFVCGAAAGSEFMVGDLYCIKQLLYKS